METEQHAVEEVVLDNGPSAADLEAEAAIAAIGEEFAPIIAAEGDENGEPVADPETPELEAEANAPQPEPEDKPADDRGMERLVAREVELRAKEDAIKAREAKVSEYESRIKELEGRVAALPSDFVEQLATTPTAALKAAGHDPDQVMRLYLAEKLIAQGKPVPAELQSMIDKAEQKATVKRLEAQIAYNEQMRAAEAYFAKVDAGARQYVTKGISKDAPTVAEVAKANPDRVYNEILDEIARDAANRAGKDSGDVISYDEAAKRVEARWAEMRKLFGPAPAASTPAAEKKSTQVAPKGASVTPPKTPGKPLTIPKAKSEDDLLNEAISAGVSEFQRSETARKRPVA